MSGSVSAFLGRTCPLYNSISLISHLIITCNPSSVSSKYFLAFITGKIRIVPFSMEGDRLAKDGQRSNGEPSNWDAATTMGSG